MKPVWKDPSWAMAAGDLLKLRRIDPSIPLVGNVSGSEAVTVFVTKESVFPTTIAGPWYINESDVGAAAVAPVVPVELVPAPVDVPLLVEPVSVAPLVSVEPEAH